jgi:hypothetical protein
MFGTNNPGALYQMTPPNPAFVKWIQSVPTGLTDDELAVWFKANPAPPKTPPPVTEAVAQFIADEVKRQVAAALASKSA